MSVKDEVRHVPVILEGLKGETSKGVIYARRCSDREAARLGIIYCGIIYVLGGVSLLNPLLHFVVPPLWIIAGPLSGRYMYRKFRGRQFVDDGKGQCPLCLTPTVISFPEAQWPRGSNKCPACREYFIIRLSTDLPEGQNA